MGGESGFVTEGWVGGWAGLGGEGRGGSRKRVAGWGGSKEME